MVLYGPKWVAAVLPLRIFLIYALQRSIGSPVGVIFNSSGRPDIGLKINLVVLPFYFGSIFIGNIFGLNGIAAAVTTVKTISGFVAIYFASRLIGLSYNKVLKTLWPPLQAALIVGLTAFSIKMALYKYLNLSPILTLIICTVLGGLVYILLLLTRYTDQLDDILLVLDSFSIRISHFVRTILRRQVKVISSGGI